MSALGRGGHVAQRGGGHGLGESGVVGRGGSVAQGGGGQGLGESGAYHQDKSRFEKVQGNIASVSYGGGTTLRRTARRRRRT